MLTPYDISIMEDDVRNVIDMWNTKLSVLKPLPVDQQTHWNEHMHEYSGPIDYNRYDNVPMERKDQMNTNIYDTDIMRGAGDREGGYLVYTTSDLNTFVDDTCRLIINNEQWKITEMRSRIGEKILILLQVVGSDEAWSDTPHEVIDMAVV